MRFGSSDQNVVKQCASFPTMRNFETPASVAKNIPNNNGTITAKTKYKDYTEFLDNYSSSKRDEVDSVSSIDSGFSNGTFKITQCRSNSTSSSSLNSEVSNTSLKSSHSINKASYGSYKEFLENYNSKKFSSVRPSLNNSKKPTVKSEIFIQVNGAPSKSEMSNGTKSNNINCVSQNKTEPPVLRSCQSFSYGTTQSSPVKSQEKTVSNGAAKLEEKNYVPAPPKMPETLLASTIPVPPKLPATNGTLPRSTVTSFNTTNNKTSKTLDKREERCGFIPPTPEFLENRLKKLNSVDLKSNQAMYDTTTVIPIVDENGKIDKNDPNVKKLVYNTYRGLLGAYNNKANDMISTLPKNMVYKDKGISKQLESIA